MTNPTTSTMPQAMDSRAVLILFVCCMVWGLQPIALKLASGMMPPVMQLAVRSWGSALCLALWLFYRGVGIIPPRLLWRAGAIVGVLFLLEFYLVGLAIHWTHASHLTVGLYTAPIFVAIGMHFHSNGERLNLGQWLGVWIAFGGIALAFLVSPANGVQGPVPIIESAPWGLPPHLWGDILSVGAGLAWALTTLGVRYSVLAKARAEDTLMMQLLVGALGLSLLGVFPHGEWHWPPINWDASLIALLIFQAVVVSFASYLTWFWLLRQYLASRISVFSFMTPLFGVGFSAWLLAEPIGWPVLVGALLVVTGIILVSRR